MLDNEEINDDIHMDDESEISSITEDDEIEFLLKRFEGDFKEVNKVSPENNKRKISKKSKTGYFFIVIFCGVLLSFLILGIITPDRTYSEKENRTLASQPEFSINSVLSGEYMKRAEKYLSDQLPFRDIIVSTRTGIMRVICKKEINDVVIGKDGWLFKKQAEYTEKADDTLDKLNSFSDECGIENQTFMLIPNSTCIVDSKLPDGYIPEDQGRIIGDIYSKINDNMLCFDTCSVLKNVEDKETLYYKTDHHWTTTAAKTVFDEFATLWLLDTENIKYRKDALAEDFYGTLSSSSGLKAYPDTVSAVIPENSIGTYIVQNISEQTRKTSVFDLSKLDTINKYEVFFGGNFSRINIDTVYPNGNKLLVLKDSYANCFIPMLTPFFSEIVIIDARYSTEKVKNIVEQENFTHLLVLYNLNTFLEDVSLKDIL